MLNPFAARSIPAGYVAHDLFDGEGPVLVNACHGDWIRQRLAPYVHIAACNVATLGPLRST